MSYRPYISQSRIRFLAVMIVLMFSVYAGRLVYLHLGQEKKWGNVISGNRNNFEVLRAARGSIIDSRGHVLATNRTVIEVGVDPQSTVAKQEELWQELAAMLDYNYGELKEVFNRKYFELMEGEVPFKAIRWKKLAEVSESKYEKIKALGIKGVYGNRKFERVYPNQRVAAHLLGFMNKEGTAVCGVESMMDFYLKGQNGWLETEMDGKKTELGQFRKREVEAQDGYQVKLSVDTRVQSAIEAEIERVVKEMNPEGVMVVATDPATGYVLGMGSYPDFNPNRYWESPVQNHRNRVLTDVFEPGSPFKAITFSAALEEGLIDFDETYDCNQAVVQYRNRKVRLPKDHRPLGVLTTKEVIKKSSNRGVAMMAMRLGDERFYEYTRNFGFGEKTGLKVSPEVAGTVLKPSKWDGLTISRMPMGHALSATAIQLHSAMGAIANRGVLMEPQVVLGVYDDNGDLVQGSAPRAKRRVISAQTAETVIDLLKEVVGPEGTSKRASIQGYSVAGKSGTSQKIINGQYSHNRHVGVFSGFFPAEDPQIAITIAVDDPRIQGVGYGGLVAAPSFRRIGEELVPYLAIQPEWVRGNKQYLAKAY